MRKILSTLLALLTITAGAKVSQNPFDSDNAMQHGETEPAPVSERPRILITTDIGGTDPDDNQSMMHYLLYSNKFDCEGLATTLAMATTW